LDSFLLSVKLRCGMRGRVLHHEGQGEHGSGPVGPGPDRGRGSQGKQGASKELNKDVRDFSGENLSEDRFY